MQNAKRLLVPRAPIMQYRADLHNKTQEYKDIHAESGIENKCKQAQISDSAYTMRSGSSPATLR